MSTAHPHIHTHRPRNSQHGCSVGLVTQKGKMVKLVIMRVIVIERMISNIRVVCGGERVAKPSFMSATAICDWTGYLGEKHSDSEYIPTTAVWLNLVFLNIKMIHCWYLYPESGNMFTHLTKVQDCNNYCAFSLSLFSRWKKLEAIRYPIRAYLYIIPWQ